MTTEGDFQAMLDANPDDHVTRLVFADWLQERADPRAEGYRALGVNGLRPDVQAKNPSDWFWWIADCAGGSAADGLPFDWFAILDPNASWGNVHTWPQRDNDSRRFAEDAAALAFARLPAERRAELLATVTV